MTGVQTCALPICFPVTIKAALKTKTVLEMITELGQTIQTLEVRVQNAEHDAHEAKSKLSMWSKLNGEDL